jgi:anti-sigma factor RsiW
MSHHPKADKDCKELFARLSAYLDGELSPENRSELEEHICGCPPCIEFIESLRRTVDLCRGFQSTESPAPISAQAREQLLAACRKRLAARSDHPSV